MPGVDFQHSSRMEFTYLGYRSLVQRLKAANYRFISFAEANCALRNCERFALMRHDIDFDLGKAAEMAKVEKDEGILSTYFFMLRTEHYNVFSREGTLAVHEILAHGHRLGLHFDCASYPEASTAEQFAAACRQEARVLEDWFAHKVEIVSYHRPSPSVLKGDPEISYPYQNT